MRTFIALVAGLWIAQAGYAQDDRTAERLDHAIRAAGVAIVGVSIGDPANKATWKVQPETSQAQAQPIIDAFNANDPAYVRAAADAEVNTDTLAADLLTAMLRHWPAIQAEITAGTYQEAQWRQRILTTARGLRRARKGV